MRYRRLGCTVSIDDYYDPTATVSDEWFCKDTYSTRRRELTHTTTSGGDPIVHCNDPTASNYDSNCNTGSAGNCGQGCIYIECADSTDPFHYNPTASNDLGCTRYGCTDETAFNYDSTANTEEDPTTCIFVESGCTDSTADEGYDSAANSDDGLLDSKLVTGPLPGSSESVEPTICLTAPWCRSMQGLKAAKCFGRPLAPRYCQGRVMSSASAASARNPADGSERFAVRSALA